MGLQAVQITHKVLNCLNRIVLSTTWLVCNVHFWWYSGSYAGAIAPVASFTLSELSVGQCNSCATTVVPAATPYPDPKLSIERPQECFATYLPKCLSQDACRCRTGILIASS
jgi:hypothetical protein